MTSIPRRASAEDDLDLIFVRVAEHDVPAAEKLVRRLRSSLIRLAEHPYSAPALEEIGDGLRALSTLGHRIFYLIVDERVEIVRVIDARRDIDSALRRER